MKFRKTEIKILGNTLYVEEAADVRAIEREYHGIFHLAKKFAVILHRQRINVVF